MINSKNLFAHADCNLAALPNRSTGHIEYAGINQEMTLPVKSKERSYCLLSCC